jgi:hypothetical protein
MAVAIRSARTLTQSGFDNRQPDYCFGLMTRILRWAAFWLLILFAVPGRFTPPGFMLLVGNGGGAV